jgi:hypothetical protein
LHNCGALMAQADRMPPQTRRLAALAPPQLEAIDPLRNWRYGYGAMRSEPLSAGQTRAARHTAQRSPGL